MAATPSYFFLFADQDQRRRKPLSWLLATTLSATSLAYGDDASDSSLWTCSSVGSSGEWVCDFETSDLPPGQNDAATLPQITPRALSRPAEPPASKKLTAESMAPLEPQEIEPPEAPYQADAVAELAQDADTTGYLRAYPYMFAQAPQFRQTRHWACESESGDWVCRDRLDSSEFASLVDASTFAYAYLDWYPNPDGSDPRTHCSGRYVEPAFRQDLALQDGEEPPLFIEADSAQSRLGEQTTLSGKVRLMRGERHLHGRRAELDERTGVAELHDQVLFREPGLLMLGDHARFNTRNSETAVDNARFVMHSTSLRGQAAQLQRLEDQRIRIQDGAFTRCEPGNNAWTVHGKEIELRPDTGFGAARHATLRVAGVPVLYVPYLYFPIDDRRQSGFLTPSVGYADDNGVDISAPYYFNIAPNLDNTLTPRVLGRRGAMLENELRYLNTRGSYTASLAYLPNDDQAGDDRWLLDLKHRGQLLTGWQTYLDYTAVSDDDYFDELEPTELEVSRASHLKRVALLSHQDRTWRFSTLLEGYQTIDSAAVTPYRKLPELQLSGYWPSDSQLTLDYQARYTHFDRDSTGFAATDLGRVTGQRAHMETTLGYPLEWPWAYVRPQLRLMHTQYNLDNQLAGQRTSVGRTLPLLSLDSGLVFERAAGSQRDHIQTLEPRLYYLHVPHEDQSDLPLFDTAALTFGYNQLFRDNRFSGYDRIGDTDQLTAALSTRVLDPAGREKFRLSLGQIVYFSDRQVRLNASDPTLTEELSDLAAETHWQLNRHLRLTADALWRHNDYQNQKRNLKLHYKSDLDHVLSLGYRYTADSLEQTDTSLIWPLTSNWSLLGRWLRDVRNHENLEELFGLEYESCCWRTRLMYRAWIDDNELERNNQGIFLQITLKGLGTAGTGTGSDTDSNFLEEITGFNEREEHE